MIGTLAHRCSSESTHWELSNEYQHNRVWMVFNNLCVLVLWTKVASALEGLISPTCWGSCSFCDFSTRQDEVRYGRLPGFALLAADQRQRACWLRQRTNLRMGGRGKRKRQEIVWHFGWKIIRKWGWDCESIHALNHAKSSLWKLTSKPFGWLRIRKSVLK